MLFEFDLENALEAHPLPEGLEDVVMNREQLAVALHASKPTIDNWMSKGMPVQEDGTNGKAYRFQLSHCFAWRMASKHFEESKRKEADAVAQQMALQFLNLDEEEEQIGGLSADQLEEFERRERLYNALEEGRKNRVLRTDVLNVMGTVFTILREHLQTQPDTLEREVGLSSAQTAAVVSANDDLIVEIKNSIEQHPVFADVNAKLEGAGDRGGTMH